MSGECQNCGEHALECICHDYNNDNLIATLVTQCLHVMKDYGTTTKMTACYNLTERVLRLFSIQCSKEDVTKLMDTFHEGIKQSIEEYYE